jgi:hypothetical protein
MPARNHSTIGFANCSCGGVRDACGGQRGTFQGRRGFDGTLPIRETAWKDEGGGSKPRWSSRSAMNSKSIRKSKRRSSIPRIRASIDGTDKVEHQSAKELIAALGSSAPDEGICDALKSRCSANT